MEDPWGHNAWNTKSGTQEEDLSLSVNPSTWDSNIRWNLNDDSVDSAAPWGSSSSFASIGAALTSNSTTPNTEREDPTPIQSPTASRLPDQDPWAVEPGLELDTEPEPEPEPVATSPTHISPQFTPESPTLSEEIPQPYHPQPESPQEEELDDLTEPPATSEHDPWGSGVSSIDTFSPSPFGIPAVKLDDAFPISDTGRPFEEQDPSAFESPPPLPASLDEVPSTLHEPVVIPDPDDWAQDNAWGPSVAAETKEEEEDEGEEPQVDDDEWSRVTRARQKQDQLVPPEKLQAILNDAIILLGPPTSPILSKRQSSTSSTVEEDDDWRAAPHILFTSLVPTLEIISSSDTTKPTETPLSDEVDPWTAAAATTSQNKIPDLPSATSLASPNLTLPSLKTFPDTNIFKSFQTGLRLTRNSHVAKSSVLAQFIHQPTSSQFEKWEASLRVKKELTTEQKDEGAVPKGWRISVPDTTQTPSKVSSKTGGGIFSSFFASSSSSTKPMPGFGPGSSSRSSPVPTPRTSISAEKTSVGTPRSSLGIERPSVTKSPVPAGTTTVHSVATSSQPTMLHTLPEVPASLLDAPPTTSSPSPSSAVNPTPSPATASPTTISPQTSEGGGGGAVSRFFSRLTSKRSSTPVRGRNGSMQLTSDDLEFLSDVVSPSSSSAVEGMYGDGGLGEPNSFSLSGVLDSTHVLPAKLEPPPKAPTLPPPNNPKHNPHVQSETLGSGGLNTRVDDDDDGFGGFSEFTRAPDSVVVSSSSPPPPIPAAATNLDQFDLIFGSTNTPSQSHTQQKEQPLRVVTSSSRQEEKKPTNKPKISSSFQHTQAPGRYTPPPHLVATSTGGAGAGAGAKPKRRQTPVVIMSSSASSSKTQSVIAPLAGPDGAAGGFMLPPPHSRKSTPRIKEEVDLFAGLDDFGGVGGAGAPTMNVLDSTGAPSTIGTNGMQVGNSGVVALSSLSSSSGNSKSNVLDSVDLRLGTSSIASNAEPFVAVSGSGYAMMMNSGSGGGSGMKSNVLDSFDLRLGTTSSQAMGSKKELSYPSSNPNHRGSQPSSNVLDSFDLSLGSSQGESSNPYAVASSSLSSSGFDSLASSTSSNAPLAKVLGGFDDFDDFISAGDASFSTFEGGSGNQRQHGTLRTPSPPLVPAKPTPPPHPSTQNRQQSKITLQIGNFALPPPSSAAAAATPVARKGSLPLLPSPEVDREWSNDFGFEDPITRSTVESSRNGIARYAGKDKGQSVPHIQAPPPPGGGKGFGWTPSNPHNPLSVNTGPTPSSFSSSSLKPSSSRIPVLPPPLNTTATLSSSSSQPVVSVSPPPPLTPNTRRRNSQKKTLSLIGMAAQTKGVRWPAPPSPLFETIIPPPPPPPVLPGNVKTNADVFGLPGGSPPPPTGSASSSGGGLLSPPDHSKPQKGVGIPLLEPPGSRRQVVAVGDLPPPSSSLSIFPPSNGGGGDSLFGQLHGSEGQSSQGSFGNLVPDASKVGVPPPPSSKQSASTGMGGLSAQDLSFFEGL